MEEDLIKLCRTCGKKNYIFCDLNHEVVQKLLKFIPCLVSLSENSWVSREFEWIYLQIDADKNLTNDVCVTCYQMIKTLVFNIEGIKDMQKILLIQNAPKLQISTPTQAERKRSLVDDITKKYSNIKVRKISVQSPEKPVVKPTELSPPKITKVVVVEEPPTVKPKTPKVQTQKPKSESPPKQPEATRSFMCISCSEKFSLFTQLEIHLKSCKTSSNQQFKCFCGKVLATKQELSKHVSVNHKQNKRHICPVCQKVVTSFSNLQNHMMTDHKSPHSSLKNVYMCHVCHSKHSDLQGLNNHRASCKGKPNESWRH